MPRLTSNGLYICSREDLKQFLEETCTDLLERLGTPMNEPEEKIMDKEILAALAYLDHCIAQQVQLPIIYPEGR